MVNFFYFFKKFFYFFNIDYKNNIYILFLKKEYLLDFFYFFKKSLFFKNNMLIDLSLVDFLLLKNRFLCYYNFLNIFFNYRLFIYFYIDDLKVSNNYFSSINSLSSIYNSANWLEREVWDMFGIFFNKHKDLRRILTDYGFFSYPLRKDFPLTGFFEVRYDDNLKNIVVEKLKLTQEFRFFNFINPWKN